jgi:hypothetical protein
MQRCRPEYSARKSCYVVAYATELAPVWPAGLLAWAATAHQRSPTVSQPAQSTGGGRFWGGYLHDVIWGVAQPWQDAKFGRRVLHIIPDHRAIFHVLPRLGHWPTAVAKMGHFQAVFTVVWAGYTPPCMGSVAWYVATNITGHSRQAMYITSCSWGWSGPYSMVEYPGHAAATKPDMRCVLSGCCQARNGATLVQPSV